MKTNFASANDDNPQVLQTPNQKQKVKMIKVKIIFVVKQFVALNVGNAIAIETIAVLQRAFPKSLHYFWIAEALLQLSPVPAGQELSYSTGKAQARLAHSKKEKFENTVT